MTNTFQRLKGLLACAVILSYSFAFLVPTALWAESTASATPALQKKKSHKTTAKHKVKKEKPVPLTDLNSYPPILIGPGDILDIQVYGENGGTMNQGLSAGSALPVEYQVDSDGIITFPYIGNVFLGGFTPAEASAKIAKLLYKPRKVTVLIKNSNTYWVSILGNVFKPGKYQIRGKPTLLSALAEAGGPLPDSDLGGTILVHKGYKNKVDLNNFLKNEGKLDPEPYLYPGDVLEVAKSGAPTLGEIAIVTSILASAAVITVELTNLRK